MKQVRIWAATAALLGILLLTVSGCASTVVETAADAAIAVAKVPFKVGGAVIHAVSSDKDKQQDQAPDKAQ